MTRQGFIDALSLRDRLPEEAIGACLDQPEACIPTFLLLLEREARGLNLSADEEQALFFAAHILAALRVQTAFSPLADILSKTPERAALLFRDAIGDSIPQVLIATGRGQADKAWDMVSGPNVEWMVREAFLRHWTFEALQERVPEHLVMERLRLFPIKVAPEPDNFLWAGWMTAIADLGLVELEPLVTNLFETGHIAKDEFGYLPVDRAAFREDLVEAARLRKQGPIALAKAAERKGYRPFGSDPGDFASAARHIMPLRRRARAQGRYPAPLLRVAEPDKDFTS